MFNGNSPSPAHGFADDETSIGKPFNIRRENGLEMALAILPVAERRNSASSPVRSLRAIRSNWKCCPRR